MSYHIRMAILLLITALPVITGAFHYRMLNKADRLFYYLCVLSFVTESTAYYSAVKFGNNIAIYNISNILQMLLACLYFNYAIDSFRKRKTGLILGVLSVILGVLNILFLQSLYQIADYFILYQALVMITLCVIALLPRLRPDYKEDASRWAEQWFVTILGGYWTLTYFLFSFIKFYTFKSPGLALDYTWGLYIASILTSIAIAIVFFKYQKLNSHVRSFTD